MNSTMDAPILPVIQVIIRSTDRSQIALLKALSAKFSDRLNFVVTDVCEKKPKNFPFPWHNRGDDVYLYYIHTSSVVLILDRRTRFTRYNLQQFCVAVAGPKTYASHGLQIKHMARNAALEDRDWSDYAFGFVFGAESEEVHRIPPATVRFTPHRRYAELADNVSTCLEALLKRIPQRRPRCYLFAKTARSAKHIPNSLIEYFQRAVESGEVDLVLCSTAATQELVRIGLPVTHLIPETVAAKVLKPEMLGNDDLVLYDDFKSLAQNRLQSHKPIYIHMENTRLLTLRSMIDIDVLRELAADPFAFHKVSLNQKYDVLNAAKHTVSIIIPHFNTAPEKLERCLRSAIACRGYHAAVEIILVDDGSQEDIAPYMSEALGSDWSEIRYFRKENEGLGLTRNFGVRQATGDYLFFLDSDDEVVSENIRFMLAHALAMNVGLVVGKRILCDAEGNFLRDSLDYIFRAISRSVSSRTLNVYDDHMANNKFVRREDFLRGELWFPSGFYEDNVFSAKLYSHFSRAEYLNFIIHRWYQYDAGDSITKTTSKKHIYDKFTSLKESWAYLSDMSRVARIKYNLNIDIPVFLSMASSLPLEDHQELFEFARRYALDRIRYVESVNLSREGENLFSAFKSNSLYPVRTEKKLAGSETRRSRMVFFPRSHYQLLQAISFAIEEEAPVIVVLANNLPGFDGDLSDKLKGMNIFYDVLTYSNNQIGAAFEKYLAFGSGSYGQVFHELFKSYDSILLSLRHSDIGVFFLECLPERYYISRKFHKVFKIEDGYNSTVRECSLDYKDGIWGVAHNTGIWGPLNIAIRKNFARFHRRPKHADRLYVSAPVPPEELVDDYKETEIIHRDFKSVMHRNRKAFSKAMRVLYGVVPDVDYNSTIILTQPLFFDYCSMKEHAALVAYLIRQAPTEKVYIKPHPMDPCDYSVLGFTVLPARMPFEYLEVKGDRVQHAITFGSSALENSLVVENVHYLFARDGFVAKDVTAEIQRICYQEKAIDLPETAKLHAAWQRNRRKTVRALGFKRKVFQMVKNVLGKFRGRLLVLK